MQRATHWALPLVVSCDVAAFGLALSTSLAPIAGQRS